MRKRNGGVDGGGGCGMCGGYGAERVLRPVLEKFHQIKDTEHAQGLVPSTSQYGRRYINQT